MKKCRILLTGANGYIGKRLLPALVRDGHEVICMVRDKRRFSPPPSLLKKISIIEADTLRQETLSQIPRRIDAAYYLIHSMSGTGDYSVLELQSAKNFRQALSSTTVKQLIYLSGIVNADDLSKHLSSRKSVEDELAKGDFSVTTLRAGIIIGAGSSSFEIIRDLVEKLPVMVAPRWLKTRCQSIGIQDVIRFLTAALLKQETYNRNFDIGGTDILTYRQMLLGYAEVRNLRRWIFTVPVMTPRLSSYWLYFITATSFRLASALVSSMKVEVVCRDDEINRLLDLHPQGYRDSLLRTFSEIEDNLIVSSWKDSMVSGRLRLNLSEFLNVPVHGCFRDSRSVEGIREERCINRIWRIGGDTGWYYADWAWKLRGLIDKLFGGVGLRRGRTHPEHISPGDSIDFWRVLYANREEGRLLLYAEMKLPGEAWLEFRIDGGRLVQTATFRPRGLLGRLYWYLLYLPHMIIFRNMARKMGE